MILISLLLSRAFALQVTTDYKTSYQRSGETAQTVLTPQDQLMVEDGQQILFQSEDQVPLLLIVPNSKNSKITLSSQQQKEILEKATQKTVDRAVNEIVNKLSKLDWQLKNKNFAQAQISLNELQEKYPRVAAVHFAQGTTHFLMNNKRAAITSLEQGLQLEPSNTDAQKLLEKLKRDP